MQDKINKIKEELDRRYPTLNEAGNLVETLATLKHQVKDTEAAMYAPVFVLAAGAVGRRYGIHAPHAVRMLDQTCPTAMDLVALLRGLEKTRKDLAEISPDGSSVFIWDLAILFVMETIHELQT